MKKKKRSTSRQKTPRVTALTDHDDLPATVGFVKEVRAEVLAEVRCVHHEVKAVRSDMTAMNQRLSGEMAAMDTRLCGKMAAMDTRLCGKMAAMDTRFSGKIVEMDTRLCGQMAEMDTRFSGKIVEMDKRLSGEIGAVRSELGAVENRLGAQIEKAISGIHQTQALMEEQRGENKIVLDGIKVLVERQGRVEGEMERVQLMLNSIVEATRA